MWAYRRYSSFGFIRIGRALFISDTHIQPSNETEIRERLSVFVDLANNGNFEVVGILGDIVDRTTDAEWGLSIFNEYWNQINTEKIVVLGNHDLGSTNYNELIQLLGYENNQSIVGSKFNYKVETENTLYIVLDNTVNAEGQHGDRGKGVLAEGLELWIENILISTKKPVVILTHFPPANENFFEEQDANTLKNTLVNNLNNNVLVISGHVHPSTLRSYPNWSENIGLIDIPALLDRPFMLDSKTLNQRTTKYSELTY